MSYLLLALLAGCFVALVAIAGYVTVRALREAPDGHEDERGFHLQSIPREVLARRVEVSAAASPSADAIKSPAHSHGVLSC